LGSSLAAGSGSANPMLATGTCPSKLQPISKARSPGKMRKSSFCQKLGTVQCIFYTCTHPHPQIPKKSEIKDRQI
jgi:hypothetical protein